MSKKVVIAMSGGVDSSVSALLMKKKGYECIGATMKLFSNDDIGLTRKNTCCSLDDVEDARSVAQLLGIPYYVFNFTDRFKTEVIDRFIYSYENGLTPNPCIDCNRYLKFDKLFCRMKEIEYDCIVTGHYARTEYDEATGRHILKKAIDLNKDQSYVLYSMTQEQLSSTIFPLGELLKDEVRTIAENHHLTNARKHDSQDICFVQSGSYADFIESYTHKSYPHGNFIDKDGNILGEHKGIIHYTIGQRKGLGISSTAPLYVGDVRPDDNTVLLLRENELYSKTLIADKINLISVSDIKNPMRVKAKIRYRHAEKSATVIQTDTDIIKVEFDEPQRAVTKGQAVVLYDGDRVVGGGTIQRAF